MQGRRISRATSASPDGQSVSSRDQWPVAAKAGLVGESVGMSLHAGFAAVFGPRGLQPRQVAGERLAEIIGEVFGEIMPRRFVATLEPLPRRERPDLVVYESGNLGGALAAKLTGVASVGHGFGRFGRVDQGDAIRRRPGEYADELGVPGAELPSFGDPVIDICPESAQSPDFLATARRVPLRPVGWAEPGDLPAWVTARDRDRPLVYLTLGTAMGSVPVLRTAVDGLARLDADVLVATGPSVTVAELGAMPPNVRLEAWVPQADLLRHVDLVVHRGGSGTTLGRFAAGLPQLLLPRGAPSCRCWWTSRANQG